MKRRAAFIIFSLLMLLLVSCTFSLDGSTAIQEVFARELYDEGVYLDKGGLTLIIKQDKSVTPLDYYEVAITKLDSEDKTTVKIEYKDNFDIIKPLDIERGIYTFKVTGYKNDVDVCYSGDIEYVLSEANSTLEISVVAKGHTHNIVWLSDVNYHWRGCSLCSYVVPDTKAKHTYPDTPESDGFYYCTVCGMRKPIEMDPSAFNAKEAQIEPIGHYTGTKSGIVWTLTFFDDNPSYPSKVVGWYVDGSEVKTDSNTLEIEIEEYVRRRILCVYKNDRGYGSYEAMIDGNWENYEI